MFRIEELIEELKKLNKSLEDSKINEVGVGDFVVRGNASLGKLEESVSRLIAKHKDFAQMRGKKKFFEGQGMV